jgi:hypothetical protein
MPQGDRTGPMGAGPQTGRGAGYCAGFAVPGCANGGGVGFGGRGRGRGRRNMFYATGLTGWQRAAAAAPVAPAAPVATPPSPAMPQDEELARLKQQAEDAAAILDSILQRVDELQNKAQA